MRQILLILAIVSALGILGYTVWEQRGGPVEESDPWAMVPSDALLIVEIPKPLDTWAKTSNTSQIWQSLSGLEAVADLSSLLDRAMDHWRSDASIEKVLSENELLIVVRHTSNEELAVELLIGSPSNVPPGQLIKALTPIFPTLAEARSEQSTSVPKNGQQPWKISLKDNVLMLSSSEEDGQRLTMPSKTVAQLRSTFGSGADAHLIFHTERGLDLVDHFLEPTKRGTHTTLSGYIAADVQLRSGSLLMSGVLLPDSNETDLNAFGTSGNELPHTLSLLPTTTDHFRLLKYKGARELRDARERVIDRKDPMLKVLSDTLGTDPIELLTSWVDGELLLAQNTLTDDAWVLISTYQSDIARSALLRFSDDVNTVTHRDIEIMAINGDEAFAWAFGAPFHTVKVTHGVVLNNAAVLCNSLRAAKAAINAHHGSGTLLADDRAAKELDALPLSARSITWMDVARNTDHLLQWLNVPDTSTSVRDALSSLGGAMFAVLQQKNGLHYVSASLHHAPLERRGSNILWAAELPSQAVRRPDLVINHYTRAKEAFMQLEDHSVLLVSSAGKVLWNIPLDGPILGEVFQVDRYRNGKLQMLFNTANKLHLIDRNGNNVEGYPIAISSTAPLALFDYDGDGKQRILIPNGNSISNFDITGEQVKGWNEPHVGSVTRPVEHLRIRNKDYLMAVTDEGKIHLLDRQGKDRYQAGLSVAAASDHPVRVKPGASIGVTRVTWIDTTGRMISGFVDDPTGTPISDVRLDDHHLLFDLDEDGKDEVINANGTVLSIHSSDGTVTTLEYDEPVTAGPLAIDLGNDDRLIGLVMGDQVLLVDHKGQELFDTPLPGNATMRVVDLNLDNRYELITTLSHGELVAYQLSKE